MVSKNNKNTVESQNLNVDKKTKKTTAVKKNTTVKPKKENVKKAEPTVEPIVEPVKAKKGKTAPKKENVKKVVPDVPVVEPVVESDKKAAKKAPPKPKESTRLVKKVTKKAAKKAPKKAAKKAPKKKVVKELENEDEEDKKKKFRFFKVLVDGKELEDAHGRFSGKKPKQAANKALTSILKDPDNNLDDSGKIKFSIVECTRGSKRKRYYYVGERQELEKPMVVILGEGKKDLTDEQLDRLYDMNDQELEELNLKKIEYSFNNKVMKDKDVMLGVQAPEAVQVA